LVLFAGISFYIRTYFPYDQVFVGDTIKFTSVDAYFHMRLVDNLAQNYPVLLNFDPYLLYPQGIRIDNIHFFDWLLAGIIWVISLGSPTQHVIDMVGVYFPPVLAALTVIPTYFIAKTLFGRLAGIFSAGLIAILPGEFLGRSMLGFTDHHVAEVLFITTAMMFLIMAIKDSREKGLTFQHVRDRDWTIIRKPLIFSLFAGLFMGIYLITWIGALLFVFAITVYFAVQMIINHLKRQSIDYLAITGFILFFTSLLVYVLFSRRTISMMSLSIALILPVAMGLISSKLNKWKARPVYYPLSLVVLGLIGLGIFYAISPSFFRGVFGEFAIFSWGGQRTIIEMQPFLFPQGDWTLGLAWGNFYNGFLLASACILYYLFYFVLRIFIGSRISRFKIGGVSIFPESFTAEKNTLLIWSTIILLATLGQRRFAYYMAVNVAILSAFLSWHFFRLNKEVHGSAKYLNMLVSLGAIIYIVFLSGIPPIVAAIIVAVLIAFIAWQFAQTLDFWMISRPRVEPQQKDKHKGRSPAGFSPIMYYSNITIVVVMIFILVFFPSIIPAARVASAAQFAPNDAWVRSLDWMRENTPEPFDDPDFYNQIYEPPLPGEQYGYPDSSYAVMAWVDYGYWIARIAHRPVNLTPGPGGFYVARYLLSPGEDASREVEWKTAWEQETIPENTLINKLGARYIMLDNETVTSKLWALANWAEQENTQYFETYFIPQEEDKLIQATLFHPEYYHSIAVRLYNFDGKAVIPEQTAVISYEEKPFQEGGTVKVVNNVELFSSYEEATAYLSSQESGQHRIVGESPFISPVPLEELEYFKMVYSSPESLPQPGVDNVPTVKIFEYIPGE
jgi:dolichyl-diphosphooligosaccharide--protein glycosyltransferase